MLREIYTNHDKIQPIYRFVGFRGIVNYKKQLSAISVLSHSNIQRTAIDTYLQVREVVFLEIYYLLLSSRSQWKPVREFSSNRDNYCYVSDEGNTARKGNE